jgi:fatty-acyl-CoA synthase
VEAQIRDGSGRACAAGAPGELFLRGANLTQAYWRQPEASREAFDAEGWFRTGDIAFLDEAGYLWLVDRKKDMFISGGENVYPAEIESALAGFDGIAECAVLGVADERWGEVGHLIVVPRADAVIDLATIISFLDLRLARYKHPKHLTCLPALPRNGAGKIVKTELRALLSA